MDVAISMERELGKLANLALQPNRQGERGGRYRSKGESIVRAG